MSRFWARRRCWWTPGRGPSRGRRARSGDGRAGVRPAGGAGCGRRRACPRRRAGAGQPAVRRRDAGLRRPVGRERAVRCWRAVFGIGCDGELTPAETLGAPGRGGRGGRAGRAAGPRRPSGRAAGGRPRRGAHRGQRQAVRSLPRGHAAPLPSGAAAARSSSRVRRREEPGSSTPRSRSAAPRRLAATVLTMRRDLEGANDAAFTALGVATRARPRAWTHRTTQDRRASGRSQHVTDF